MKPTRSEKSFVAPGLRLVPNASDTAFKMVRETRSASGFLSAHLRYAAFITSGSARAAALAEAARLKKPYRRRFTLTASVLGLLSVAVCLGFVIFGDEGDRNPTGIAGLAVFLAYFSLGVSFLLTPVKGPAAPGFQITSTRHDIVFEMLTTSDRDSLMAVSTVTQDLRTEMLNVLASRYLATRNQRRGEYQERLTDHANSLLGFDPIN